MVLFYWFYYLQYSFHRVRILNGLEYLLRPFSLLPIEYKMASRLIKEKPSYKREAFKGSRGKPKNIQDAKNILIQKI